MRVEVPEKRSVWSQCKGKNDCPWRGKARKLHIEEDDINPKVAKDHLPTRRGKSVQSAKLIVLRWEI